MTTAAVELDLPDGFVVLAANDPGLVEVGEVPPPLSSWYEDVTTAAAAAGATLVAVQLEHSDAVQQPTAVSLVLHLAPLDAVEPEVAVQGLRAIALTRTSTHGEVAVLDLPLGPAVASADLQERGARAAAVAMVQLPLATAGVLATLTLCTPATELLPALAALAAAVAARLRLDERLDDVSSREGT